MDTSSPPPASPPARDWVSPLKLFLVLLLTIFSIELLLMSLLNLLDVPPLVKSLIDSALLVLLLLPILLWMVYYPMQAKLRALAAAEQAQRTAASALEEKVEARTAALTAANVALQREIEARTQMQDELKRLAETDTLTNLHNRRAFEELSTHELNRARRYAEPLSIVIFDIDYFKRINDTYGHHVGDDVLTEVARLVTERIRPSDVFARWGGEEFILLLPRTDGADAVVLANELRERLQEAAFAVVGTLTASFGVAHFSPRDTFDTMLQRADAALYSAKDAGRNQVSDDGGGPEA